ncbi:hypothetical protein C9J22_03710 [Photobacterium phosphoreum]|uniref:AAA family ATPase n=1 Tax=Photobacterium phosphoreum TaxID=659 RepID=UPI000D17B3D6|nr:ATP-binding protein [Photobacterium phosphoreum]PSU73056.1 hypothetical protein C9J22_03710 [Photobacterium phosphoreum]
MIINEITIEGLNNSQRTINLKFNRDVNIITGRNGSGKTTILKLIWFCISANIERAVQEIIFSKVIIDTSKYTLEIEITENKNKEFAKYRVILPDGDVVLDKKEPIRRDDAVEEANKITVELFDTSVFFPTFRRIEGGFSMQENSKYSRKTIIRHGVNVFLNGETNYGSRIQEAIESHADRLSVKKHRFVSSISTVDIKQLISDKHNEATNKVNYSSESLSKKIFAQIREHKKNNKSPDALENAILTLDKINDDVQELEKIRDKEFNSLSVLSQIITQIFSHKGIRINTALALGDLDESINSDALSAGEKQMLSFLCYNALYSNCPFFIDEPELSLHVDWQRMLLDVLLEQNTNNQLFIATHSPFIYTQFEDKEIMMSDDRGHNFE